jgi:8-hydroxy-5-deazaflavin:NADPH oxidoreductase
LRHHETTYPTDALAQLSAGRIMASKARIGVLGSGDVGQRLAGGFASHGYDVMLGSRTPKSEKLQAWQKSVKGKVATGTFAEAAAHGDLDVIATHGAATEALLDQIGPKPFAGKVVIDVTNPLVFSKTGPPGLFVGTTDSLGERVQRKLPGAKVVKAFNTVPNTRMVDPKFKAGAVRLLIAGDDSQAKKRTEDLLKDLGWAGAIDVGGIESARWLEALTPLWVRTATAVGDWSVILNAVS